MEIQNSTTANADASREYYEGMTAVRRRIVRPLVIITLVAFFLQQVLTNFTSVLDGFAADGLSWAYLYAFALFFLVVVLTTVYKRAMDKVEDELRPAHLDETAAHYEDWTEWEKHEAQLEAELADEEKSHAESRAHGTVDETPTQHDKETRP
ncbi:hypothetical protein GCM10011374_08710 [Kocuria dechangensis]|uniref:Uncharacterized protein n=1 Tax=Kocuria dechangensis TaxID=1176249 RepID=A0A917GJB8_9MICC|nr:DUF485 domain-containing protein [Kocuria dechangensis]GGG48576.1 hypothetical protein GCM10011374_08710 [Kocuria dechangensis]